MGERIFDSGVRCGVVVLENEVVADELRDGCRPFDVGVGGGVVD